MFVTASSSATETKVEARDLPLVGFYQALVEPRHRHVFLTGNPFYGNIVLVVDFKGRVVRTLRRQPGAAGLLLHGKSVYVALSRATAIAEIDTRTLRERRRFRLGRRVYCPDWLVWADGRIWFAGACPSNYGATALAWLDPRTGKVRTFSGLSVPESHALLAASPAAPARVVAADRGQTPANVYSYGVSAGRPRLLAKRAAGLHPAALAFLRGGRQFVTAGNNAYWAEAWTANNLERGRRYPTQGYPQAAAVSEDGRVLAIGVNNTAQPVYVFEAATGRLIKRFRLEARPLAERGLVFAPKSHVIFAFALSTDQTHIRFYVLRVS